MIPERQERTSVKNFQKQSQNQSQKQSPNESMLQDRVTHRIPSMPDPQVGIGRLADPVPRC